MTLNNRFLITSYDDPYIKGILISDRDYEQALKNFISENNLPPYSFPELFDALKGDLDVHLDKSGERFSYDPSDPHIEDLVKSVKVADKNNELFFQKNYRTELSRTLIDKIKEVGSFMLNDFSAGREPLELPLARFAEKAVKEKHYEDIANEIKDAVLRDAENGIDIPFLTSATTVFRPMSGETVFGKGNVSYTDHKSPKEQLSDLIANGFVPFPLDAGERLVSYNRDDAYVKKGWEVYLNKKEAEELGYFKYPLHEASLDESPFGGSASVLVEGKPLMGDIHPVYVTVEDGGEEVIYKGYRHFPEGVSFDPKEILDSVFDQLPRTSMRDVVDEKMGLKDLLRAELAYLSNEEWYKNSELTTLPDEVQLAYVAKRLQRSERGKELTHKAYEQEAELMASPTPCWTMEHLDGTNAYTLISVDKNKPEWKDTLKRKIFDEMDFGRTVMDQETAFALLEYNSEKAYISKSWTPITEDAYYEALEVLPTTVHRENGASVFSMSEATYGNIRACYAEVDGEYYTANRNTAKTSVAEMVDEIREQVVASTLQKNADARKENKEKAQSKPKRERPQ